MMLGRIISIVAAVSAIVLCTSSSFAQLVISSVFDGPLPGGLPKGVELFVSYDVPDLSHLSLGVADDGTGAAGREFTFPAVSADEGQFLYVASEAAQFETFFGFAPQFTTDVLAIDGNDAIEVYSDDVWAKNIPIDVFGEAFVDGRGQPWDYTDGWAARANGMRASSGFHVRQWTFSGPGALDGATSNAIAASPVPIGTYQPPQGPVLFAGDADQDSDFDQLDLVMVQVAGKYLTGQPATWGEGDWDGAPGGSRGNPPPGNGLFDQVDIIAALSASHYLTACYAALKPDGQREDDRTSLVYDANTGEVSIDAPRDRLLSWIALSSTRHIFDNAPGINLDGRMDSDTDGYIFKKVFDGAFGSLSLGNIARPGLSELDILRDLSAIVSLYGENDEFNGIDLVYIAPVPEPATWLLVVVGLGCFRILRAKYIMRASPATQEVRNFSGDCTSPPACDRSGRTPQSFRHVQRS